MSDLVALITGNKVLVALLVFAILAVTVGRHYVIGTIASSQDAAIVEPEYADYKVGKRFLETSTGYDAGRLRAWIASHGTAAKGYAVPVLFPLDFVFMIALAGLTAGISGLAAYYLGHHIAAWLGWPPAFVWAVVGLSILMPALYLLVDVIEDSLLIAMLREWKPATDEFVATVKTITDIKIWSVTFAIRQTAVLAILAALWFVAARLKA